MRYEATERVIEEARARQRDLRDAELRALYEEFQNADRTLIFESLKGERKPSEERALAPL